jgi:hypothetical protein
MLAFFVVIVRLVLFARAPARGRQVGEYGAGCERGPKEERVLSQTAAARAGGKSAGGEGRQVDGRAAPVVASDASRTIDVELELWQSEPRSAEDGSETGVQLGPDGRAQPGGQRDRDRREQEVEHGKRVMGDPPMALTGGH